MNFQLISATMLCYAPYTASSTTPCAIPGIDLPSLKLTCDNNAPVGTNNTLFNSRFLNLSNTRVSRTIALHPQPLPPDWVSCSFLSNTSIPQSVYISLMSIPFSLRSVRSIYLPVYPKSPVIIIS